MSERISISSGTLGVGEGSVWTGRILLVACTILTDKSNDATITLYTGTGDDKEIIWKYKVPGSSDGTGRNFSSLLFKNGLSYKLEGLGSEVYLERLS